MARNEFKKMILAAAAALAAAWLAGCGSTATAAASANPTISVTAGLNGAQVVSMSGATSTVPVFYTLDGTIPTASSPRYLAPLVITATTTIKAVAKVDTLGTLSPIVSQTVTASVASGTMVFDEEFNNTTGSSQPLNPATWTYDAGTGGQGWGNNELETYCAYGSNTSPCSASSPNVFVGTDGTLHLVARQPSAGVYTSARVKSQGLISFLYGRIEARIQMPEGQGIWPAWWTLGNNYATDGWPLCGEFDLMEHINSPSPDVVWGSTHMLNGNASHSYTASGFTATTWHTYGMIWSKGQIIYYVDSPGNIYAISTAANMTASGATWPFDSSNGVFLLLNVAVGGSWPGSPNSTTVFPAEMLVDWIHVYTN